MESIKTNGHSSATVLGSSEENSVKHWCENIALLLLLL